MYNRTSFPKSGKWARHLQRLAKVSRLSLPEELTEIARTDVSVRVHPQLKFSKREINAAQYGMDWGGRFVLLEESASVYARSVAFTVADNLDSKRVIVYVSDAMDTSAWLRTIKLLAAGDRIETFDRSFKSTVVVDTESERQWLVVDAKNIHNVDLLTQFRADHIIFEMSGAGVTSLSSDIIRGLASEVTRFSIILMNNADWNTPTSSSTRQRVGSVIKLLADVLLLNRTMTSVPVQFDTVQSTAMYYRRRGIKYNDLNILEVTGTCFDLVRNPESVHFQMAVGNALARETADTENSSRRNEVVRRYITHQNELCGRLQGSISDIVDSALRGDADAISGLESLKTKDVLRNKANLFYNHIQESNKKGYKTVVVAKSPTLRQQISSQCSGVQLQSDPVFGPQRDALQANFVFPSVDWRSYTNVPAHFTPRINNLLVVDDLLTLDEVALKHVDQVIFAEFLYDRELTMDLLDLAKAFSFKVMFGTMRGTFEEELAEKLLADLY